MQKIYMGNPTLSHIEIWTESEVNNKFSRSVDLREAKIVQIEHAYEDKYIVEYIKN